MKNKIIKKEKVLDLLYYGLISVAVLLFVVLLVMVSKEIITKNNTEKENNIKASIEETDKEKSGYREAGAEVEKETLYLMKEYLLVDENGKVSIYEMREGEYVFFDYAAVEKNLMSDEIKQQLANGIHIKSEAELYEFLQAYSS